MRLSIPVLIAFLALPGAVSAASAASLREADAKLAGMDAAALRRVDAIIEKAIKDQVTPGAALAVGRNGQLVRLRGYGHTAYGVGAPRVDEHTLYDLASLTKTVGTTSAVMLLVQRGQLELDRPIADYLYEWQDAPDRSSMTIRHLLNHTSGLPVGGPLRGVGNDRTRIPAFMAAIPLQSAPGARYAYSDYGMILLGAIVERVSCQRLDRFLAAELLVPAGMLETTFSPLSPRDEQDAASAFRLAHSSTLERREHIAPTERTASRGTIHGVVHDPLARRLDGVAGHAGLFSSAHDLALYCEMLLAGGALGYSIRIFQPEVLAEFSRRPSESARFALGWELAREDGPSGKLFPASSFGHTGFTGTSIWLDPEHGLYVVLLTNRLHPNVRESRHIKLRKDVHDAVQRALVG